MPLKEKTREAAPTDITRSLTFEFRARSDGQTLDGYAAVFNTLTRIDSWEGEFDEQIVPGAFARYLADSTPVLMFEHGHHPLLGSMPLGSITTAEEDTRGLHVIARLTNNWLIQPVRDAIRDGAIDGMSFRFLVRGETWTDPGPNEVPLRTLTDVDVPELGPVVFPAYEPTTVSVRSALERIPLDLAGRSSAESDEGSESEAGPQERAAEHLSYDHVLLTRGWLNAMQRGR